MIHDATFAIYCTPFEAMNAPYDLDTYACTLLRELEGRCGPLTVIEMSCQPEARWIRIVLSPQPKKKPTRDQLHLLDTAFGERCEISLEQCTDHQSGGDSEHQASN